MLTLLAIDVENEEVDAFHCSVRMRRATSRRNALTSSPDKAASVTWREVKPKDNDYTYSIQPNYKTIENRIINYHNHYSHHTSTIIADCNATPSLRLDLPGYWPDTEMKQDVWLLRTWFGIEPVNKLLSLTWLLWALRRFWRFTLHYTIRLRQTLSVFRLS